MGKEIVWCNIAEQGSLGSKDYCKHSSVFITGQALLNALHFIYFIFILIKHL